MKRVALVAAILLLLLAAPWGVGAQEAVDVSVVEVSWWSSSPTALEQPAGGFEVAAGPTGDAQSVAALRLSIAATHVDSLQVRFVEASSVGTELGVLRMCVTTAPWTAANPGALADAPTPDCTVATNLTRTTDGVWLGDVAALAPNGGDVSLMILPLYQPPVPIGPGMLVTISGGEFTANGSSPTATTELVPDSTETTFVVDQPTTDLFGPSGGGSFGVPATDVVPDFGTVTNTAPASSEDPGLAEDDFALTPVKSDDGSSTPWVRLVLLLPLSAGFGVGTVRLRRSLAAGLLWAR